MFYIELVVFSAGAVWACKQAIREYRRMKNEVVIYTKCR